MPLCLIYARSENYCIGRQGRIPWQLPDEFAHFKRTTRHHPVIMGRRTYEDHETLLPDRPNIVITRTPHYQVAGGVELATSLEAALGLAAKLAGPAQKVFVVGGVSLFVRCFPDADRVYETVVHTHIDAGDTFVPAFDFSGWSQQELGRHDVDERHAFAYTVTLHRRRQGV